MSLNMAHDRPASESVDENLEDYRATPKKYFLSTADQLVDNANRYWIATQRDTHEWSYLDVYENAEYVGSVRVKDRFRAFDLLGSTLVVLVERQVGEDDRWRDESNLSPIASHFLGGHSTETEHGQASFDDSCWASA